MSDPAKYRTMEELEKARERDPISVYQTVLKERGWLTDEAFEELHDKVKSEIDEVIEFSMAAPAPAIEEVYDDITVAPYLPQE
jgi:pyruvate dehydrogenase E1 component alpha subunit